MKYLVLKPFRAFGKRYERGDIVDETQVRSLRIRIGEHKLAPVIAVSSSISPAKAVSPEVAEQVTEDKKPVRLSFTKEG